MPADEADRQPPAPLPGPEGPATDPPARLAPLPPAGVVAPKPAVEEKSAPPSPADSRDVFHPEGGFSPEEFALLEQTAPCEDPRWTGFVELVGAENKRAAAHLRRMEVDAIGDGVVELILPDRTAALEQAEWDALSPLLEKSFSGTFHIRIIDDKTGSARSAFTVSGRTRLREEARLAAMRREAAGDERVAGIMRHFHNSRIIEIKLREPQAPEGSEDVQG